LQYDKNWNNLLDLNGLNLIWGYEITCHYSQSEESLIINLIKKEGINNLICLTEKNALFIEDKKMTLLGKEDCIIFNNGISKNFSPKEMIPQIQKL